MSHDQIPSLPGYGIDFLCLPGRRQSHEVGARRILENLLAVWVLEMSSDDGRREVMQELTHALTQYAPAMALRKVNDAICTHNQSDLRWASVLVLLVNRAEHSLEIASAGLNGPDFRSPDNQVVAGNRGVDTVPLGVIPDVEFSSQIADFAAGTTAVWVSPYSAQLMSPTSEMYGRARVREQIRAAPPGPHGVVRAIADDMVQFIGDRHQGDDICVLCIQRQ